MKKIQDFVLRGKKVFVGLEDSKKSWKVCVRNGQWQVVIGRQFGTSYADSYVLALYDGKPALISGTILTSPTQITTGAWYHIVGVKDGSSEKLYVNGVLKASTTGAGDAQTDNNEITIGGEFNSSSVSEFFDGVVDEAYVMGVPMSQDWVTLMYAQATCPALAERKQKPTGVYYVDGVGVFEQETAGGSAVYKYANLPGGEGRSEFGTGDEQTNYLYWFPDGFIVDIRLLRRRPVRRSPLCLFFGRPLPGTTRPDS